MKHRTHKKRSVRTMRSAHIDQKQERGRHDRWMFEATAPTKPGEGGRDSRTARGGHDGKAGVVMLEWRT